MFFVICISRQFAKKLSYQQTKTDNLELIDTKLLNWSDPSIAFGRLTGCFISNDLSLVHVTWYGFALTGLKLVIFLHAIGWMANTFDWCPWKWFTHLDVSIRIFPENSMKILLFFFINHIAQWARVATIPLWLEGWWVKGSWCHHTTWLLFSMHTSNDHFLPLQINR